MLYLPLWLWSRSAMGCLAFSVLISAKVKSEANQSVTSKPSSFLGHIGPAAEHGLMARDEHAVFRRNQIGFDGVDAHFDGVCVGLDRVFGQIAAGTAMGDDERPSVLGKGAGGGGKRNNKSGSEDAMHGRNLSADCRRLAAMHDRLLTPR